MILCISVLSVVTSPFSFLILLIWFFSLFFLMSLANGFSILFIVSKNQLLALLILAMVSYVSFAFISALSFIIPYLLLILGCFISSFSSCFRYRVRLFIWFLSCFLRYALLNPIGFGLLCFHFHSFYAYFDFFFYFICDLLVIQNCVV